jgi:hypothetical protein
MTQATVPRLERPWRGFLAGVLTTLVVLVGGFFLLMATCAGGTDVQLDRVVLSPDSSIKAVVYVGMGGGGAGWCSKRLALRPGTEGAVDVEAMQRKGEYLFSSSCGSDLRLNWLSPTQLHITYTMDEAGVSVYQRSTSDDGRVHLTYEVTPK